MSHINDFEERCRFPEQMASFGYPNSGDVIRVDMRSGKTALYCVAVTRHGTGLFDDTGQKDYAFEFLSYV